MARQNQNMRDARFPVTVTKRQCKLLRDETFADPEYVNRFRESGRSCVAGFTASELDDLLGHIAAAANHAPRVKLRVELDALYRRFQIVEAGVVRSGDAS